MSTDRGPPGAKTRPWRAGVRAEVCTSEDRHLHSKPQSQLSPVPLSRVPPRTPDVTAACHVKAPHTGRLRSELSLPRERVCWGLGSGAHSWRGRAGGPGGARVPSAPREEIQRPGAGLRSTLGGPAFHPQAPSCPPARRAVCYNGTGQLSPGRHSRKACLGSVIPRLPRTDPRQPFSLWPLDPGSVRL